MGIILRTLLKSLYRIHVRLADQKDESEALKELLGRELGGPFKLGGSSGADTLQV